MKGGEIGRFALVGVLTAAMLLVVGIAGASAPGGDVRLTNDNSSYVSTYTLATGIAYTDQTLQECSISRGRENEPAVVVDPRNTNVLLGSSNDYCGVYNRGALAGLSGRFGSAITVRWTAARASRARSCRAIRTTRRPTRPCRRLARHRPVIR